MRSRADASYLGPAPLFSPAPHVPRRSRLPRPSAADALRRADTSVAVQVAGIVGFALLAAAGAQVKLYLWEVPITLQTLAVYGAGLFLGSRNGALSMVLYLAVGMLFPVFAGEGHGLGYLMGLSGGYLLAYPLVAALIGALSKRWNTLAGSALAVPPARRCSSPAA